MLLWDGENVTCNVYVIKLVLYMDRIISDLIGMEWNAQILYVRLISDFFHPVRPESENVPCENVGWIRRQSDPILSVYLYLLRIQNIDAICGGFIITPDRKERVDFVSHPYWAETQDLVVPVPGEESRLFAFIRPFQPKVIHALIPSSRKILHYFPFSVIKWL